MKKSHEYESPVLSKLVSVVTVVAICICSVCCIVTAQKVSTISGGSAPVVNNGGSSAPSGGSSTPSGGGSSTPSGGGSSTPSGGDSSAPSGGDNTADAPAGSASKEEVLAKYTEVVTNMKANIASYEKKEFQKLDPDYDLGTIGNLVLPIAEGLMTSEEKAELQKRTDKEQIPVIHNDKGCLITDASCIKEATMTESGGKTTIVIVLNDELDPMPADKGAATAPSNHGGLFNPMSKQGIDDIVAKFSSVAKIQKFGLTYNNCTATLVFDTATNQVESLQQIMNIRIDVDAKVTLLSLKGYATLINTMNINNVQYK